MKPKATLVLVVLVFLFGTVTINQMNMAYAASSEKIPLVQKLEQFEGQEISGFCYLQQDDEKNVNWRIKVSGLAPQTQGHFDLGHWAGENDVPYTADVNGNADSENQSISLSKVNEGLFSQFAKCKVYLEGSSHFTSPVIAIGEPGSDKKKSQNTNQNLFAIESLENKSHKSSLEKSNSDIGEFNNKDKSSAEKKFYLFSLLESIFEIFNNNDTETTNNNANVKRGVPTLEHFPNENSKSKTNYISGKSDNNNSNNNYDEIDNTGKSEEKAKPEKGNNAKSEEKAKPEKNNGKGK